MLFVELEAEVVVSCVGDVAEGGAESEDEEGHGIGAHCDGTVPLLDARVGANPDAHALGHHGEGEAALASGACDVGPQFDEGTADRRR